ncbi:MAG: TetR/AcrR family transcriptional regulator [Clostridia bacterium]|nr:TetR/AcrR family transcriptional regulator [Clostridia bacterium]
MANNFKNTKDKKKEFIKTNFIEATKTTIFETGVEAVTVRGIAEMTGYSYATIYHYFSDLNELLLEAKLSMIKDMVNMSIQNQVVSDDPLQRMKDNMKIMVDFFIANPNIFRFFYFYEMDDRNRDTMIALNLEPMYFDGFIPFVKSGAILETDIPTASRAMLYTAFGLITIYLSNNGLSREDVDNDMNRIIELVLREKNNEA